MRIGIDVGGTNTDVVLLDGTSIISQAKCLTTSEVTSGILQAVKQVLDQSPSDIRLQGVMLEASSIWCTEATSSMVARFLHWTERRFRRQPGTCVKKGSRRRLCVACSPQ